MANTVTSFYTFSPGTKAKSAEVNTNFSQFRGSLIAVDPNTVAGASLTYDLGSTEYWWKDSYQQSAYLRGQTTTSTLQIVNDTTAAEWAFKVNGTAFTRLNSAGFIRHLTSASLALNSSPTSLATGTATAVIGSTVQVTQIPPFLLFYNLIQGRAGAVRGPLKIEGQTTSAIDLRCVVNCIRNNSVTVGSYIIGGVVAEHDNKLQPGSFYAGPLQWVDNLGATTGTTTYHLESYCLMGSTSGTYINFEWHVALYAEVIYKV